MPDPAAPPADPPAAPPEGTPAAPPAAPPADNNAFASIMDAEGTFVQGWSETLPDSFEGVKPTLTNYKSLGDLAQALVDNKQAARAKTEGMVRVPNENSDDAERKAFREATGVPVEAKGYNIAKPADLPEGMEWSEDNATAFADLAHKHGLTPAAVQDIVAMHTAQLVSESTTASEQADTAAAANEQDLKDGWGSDYDKHMLAAKTAAAAAGVPLTSEGFRHPDMVRMAAFFARGLSEAQLAQGDAIDPATSLRTKAKDITLNPQNPLYERYHAGDKEIIDMVGRYHKGV